ncbi:MAG: PAS domain-containing protein [Pseudanabaenaceae cyanobacterium]
MVALVQYFTFLLNRKLIVLFTNLAFVLLCLVIDIITPQIVTQNANIYDVYFSLLILSSLVFLVSRVIAREYEIEKQKLEQSNQILTQAQKTFKIGVWEYQLSEGKLVWSEQVYSIFDIDPSAGEPSLEEYKLMIPPTDWQEIETRLHRAIADGIGFKVEHGIITKRGKYKFVICNAEPIKNQQGRVTKLFGVVQDITDRKQLEINLQRSQAMLAEAQRLAKVGYWEYEPETDRVVWSEETFRIFGFPVATTAPSRQEIEARIHPKDIDFYNKLLKRKIELGLTDKSELRLLLPDGSVKYIEVIANVQRQNDRTVKIYGSILDITDRKLAEIALEENNRRLQMILEFNQLGTWEWYLADNRTVWSKQKYQLTELPDYIEPSLAILEEILYPDDRDMVIEKLRAAAEGNPLQIEFRVKLRDGGLRWLLCKAESFYQNNTLNYIAGITIDITDRKCLENSLKNQNYLLKLLATGVDLDIVITEIINIIEQEIHNSMGCVLLLEDNKVKLSKSKASPKLPAEYLQALDGLRLQDGIVACRGDRYGKAAVAVCDNAAEQCCQPCLPVIQKFNLYSCWSVPILTKDYQILGTVAVYFQQPRTPKQYELEVIEQLADIVSIAIKKQESEAELIATQERFQTIANNLPGVILRYILYPDGSDGLLYISRGSVDLWGVPAEEAVSDVNKLWASVLAEDIPEMHASILHSAETMTTWRHDWRIRTREGLLKWVSGVGIPHKLDDGSVVWDTIITDVTDQKIFESELEALVDQRTAALKRSQEFLEAQLAKEKELLSLLQTELRQKETLLKEVHHRVKNNLQIISSLLRLQIETIPDETVKTAFQDSQNRIQSMALIHERLYRSNDLSQIAVATYLRELTDYLWQTYNAYRRNIHLTLNVTDLQLEMDRLIPCGLIVNELVSNCLKYAFVGRQSGQVTINFYLCQEQYHLQVKDNGVGLPPDFHHKCSTSLGIRLVERLVKQLRGNLEIGYDRGTEFRITFPASL